MVLLSISPSYLRWKKREIRRKSITLNDMFYLRYFCWPLKWFWRWENHVSQTNELKKLSKSAKLLFSQMSVTAEVFIIASERYITTLVAESFWTNKSHFWRVDFAIPFSFTKNISMILQKRPFGANFQVCYYCCHTVKIAVAKEGVLQMVLVILVELLPYSMVSLPWKFQGNIQFIY